MHFISHILVYFLCEILLKAPDHHMHTLPDSENPESCPAIIREAFKSYGSTKYIFYENNALKLL